ncbi:MAG: tyrosine recombinase XerC [Clostridiales bacterium]|nr:tyrosine recombinase XerC [Clostridiales bacterium]MDD3418652.1 tyrosine recombinase XerC [Eubacteriales bacterium]MDD3539825.1 tyrosine recombinase XerC [Eubacteriales bacterium]MDD4186796.1 tyrosine recombinase XerC [Eubacteriales bacterium]
MKRDEPKPLDSFVRLEEFLGYIRAILERSEGTVRQYRYDLVLFFRYLISDDRMLVPEDEAWEAIDISSVDDSFLRSIQLSDLYGYIGWLATTRKTAPATRARRSSSLRTFFDYLTTKAHVLDDNVAANLESPKQVKRLPRHLSLDESRELLQAASRSDTRFSTRDYAMLTLFLNCGLRLSELCGIDLSSWRDETLTVVGKGNKERTIYLNGACISAIEDYLPDRIKPIKEDKDALFISRLGKRVTPRGVQNIIKKYIMSAGLDPARYSTHKLRHTAATLMYQYGEVDIRSLQALLGHASVATTEIYTHIDQKALHEAVEQNPLNQERNVK